MDSTLHPQVQEVVNALDPDRPIVVLSHGAGQDSAAMLALLYDDARPELQATYVGDRQLLVVHADTGAERPETVSYRGWIRHYCEAQSAVYFQIDRHLGFHSGHWAQGLHGQWDASDSIGSVAFGSVCSDRLKIGPIWKGVNAVLASLYGCAEEQRGGLYMHHKRFGVIDCLIGFGAEEARRARRADKASQLPLFNERATQKKRQKKADQRWFTATVRRRYPLIDLDINRPRAQAYLQERGLPIPLPSMCQTCHWADEASVALLDRTDPALMQYWIDAEARKRRHHPGNGKNLGVKGTISLPQFLARARSIYAALSTDDLKETIRRNGHSVKSRM